MPILVFCRICSQGFQAAGELPSVCPECHQETTWITLPPYELNTNDKTFLHSIRVEPD
jgi:Zn finger protein HypA/HybF involved in hydrogenase expression